MGIETERWSMIEGMTVTGSEREVLKKMLLELIVNGK